MVKKKTQKIETTVNKPILKKKSPQRKSRKQGWWVPTAYDLLPKMPELFSTARFRLLLEQDYGVKISKIQVGQWLSNLKKRGLVNNNCYRGQTWTYLGMPKENIVVLNPLDEKENKDLANELKTTFEHGFGYKSEPDPVSDLFKIDQLEEENLKLQYKVEELVEQNRKLVKAVEAYHGSNIMKLEAKLEVYKELLTEEMKK